MLTWLYTYTQLYIYKGKNITYAILLNFLRRNCMQIVTMAYFEYQALLQLNDNKTGAKMAVLTVALCSWFLSYRYRNKHWQTAQDELASRNTVAIVRLEWEPNGRLFIAWVFFDRGQLELYSGLRQTKCTSCHSTFHDFLKSHIFGRIPHASH